MKLRGLILFALLLGNLWIPTVKAQTEIFPTINGVSTTIDMATGEVEISKWNKESWLKLLSTGTLIGSTKEGDKFKLTYGDYFVSVYEIPGGLEYEIIIGKIPLSNVFVLPVTSEGLVFYYQPALTTEYINGVYYEEFGEVVDVTETSVTGRVSRITYIYRPENIVGSYAVYHPTKANNEYKTGKAFHIYRPLITDAKGATIWGVLNYDGVSLTVTVDQAWLSKAKYPVVVDPTFGMTGIGGSEQTQLQNRLYTCKYQLTEEASVTKISFYTRRSTEGDMPCGVYADDGGSPSYPSSLEGQTQDTTVGTSDAWHNFTFSSPVLLNAGVYWLTAGFTGGGTITTYYKYDTGSAYQLHGMEMETEWTPPTMTDPHPSGASGDYARAMSIYATYTAGGGPTNYPRSASQGITVGNDADRWFQGFRGGAQAIGFTPDGERIYGAVRSPTQGITLGSEAERLLVMGRGASQALNMLMEAVGVKSGITNFIRGATQTIHFASDATTGLINLLIYVVNTVGAALTGSTVAVWGPAGTLVGSGEVNATGYYIIPDVDLGNYTIQASKDTYQTKMGIYEVTVDQLITMSLHSIEEGIMFNIELLIFVALGCACLYVGYTTGELGNKIGAYFMSLIFWVSSMYQWIVSNPSSYGLILAFLAPFLWGFAQGMHALGAYVDQMGGKPRHLD